MDRFTHNGTVWELVDQSTIKRLSLYHTCSGESLRNVAKLSFSTEVPINKSKRKICQVEMHKKLLRRCSLLLYHFYYLLQYCIIHFMILLFIIYLFGVILYVVVSSRGGK